MMSDQEGMKGNGDDYPRRGLAAQLDKSDVSRAGLGLGLDEIDDAFNSLRQVLKELEMRIDPVLYVTNNAILTGEMAPTEIGPGSSEVATRMSRQAESLRELTHVVRDFVSRVDI